MAKVQSKDSNRQFVRYIANLLESGEFEIWLNDSTKTPEDIFQTCQGASMNRLFQLLKEGKRGSLEISSDVCVAAANRTDWFNSKQCSLLSTRAEAFKRLEMIEEAEEQGEFLSRRKSGRRRRRSRIRSRQTKLTTNKKQQIRKIHGRGAQVAGEENSGARDNNSKRRGG